MTLTDRQASAIRNAMRKADLVVRTDDAGWRVFDLKFGPEVSKALKPVKVPPITKPGTAFSRGASSMLNVFRPPRPLFRSHYRPVNPMAQIAADFNRVGDDMRKAMAVFTSKHGSELREAIGKQQRLFDLMEVEKPASSE